MTQNYIYRRKQLCEILGCSNSTIDRMISSGKLKPPIKLGARFVGFPKSEIDAFIKKQMEERDNA